MVNCWWLTARLLISNHGASSFHVATPLGEFAAKPRFHGRHGNFRSEKANDPGRGKNPLRPR
jgi:hypothetical protein